MDLWIRSQDKMKFRRVIDLGIFEEQEGYTIYCDDSIDNILGTYATKERALEVLDEIQSLIDFMVCKEIFTYDSGEFMQLTYKQIKHIEENGCIYQMPEK